LALGFEAETAIGLVVAGNADVAESVRHGVFAYYFTPEAGKNGLKANGNGGIDRPPATVRICDSTRVGGCLAAPQWGSQRTAAK
jgi:hypothetical protein